MFSNCKQIAEKKPSLLHIHVNKKLMYFMSTLENSRIHCPPVPLALNGDLIGVYQDVFLQMVEKEDTDLSSDDIENGNLKSDSKFVADRPFMVVLQIDNEVIAIGRVKVSTYVLFQTWVYAGKKNSLGILISEE